MNTKMLSKNKVVLGLSGGVDSTTAALLLKEQGFTVIGYYFDVKGTDDKDRNAAADLARCLDIDFISEDVSDFFEKEIIGNFCREYGRGRTPNPCIVCNPAVKFKKLLETADANGAYYIATGHYARIHYDSAGDIYYVRKGANQKKDQSYMLYRLGQPVLSRLILPLGEFAEKEEARKLARNHNMPNADASDSQEICFIDDEKEDYVSFLERRGICSRCGDFVDSSGNVLGRHRGISHYTVGQRKGLGIALGRPVFVTSIDAENNRVVLGSNEDLFRCRIISSNHFFAETSSEAVPEGLLKKKGITAKIRYAAKPAEAVLSFCGDDTVETCFDEPQRAAAPGQSIVFYDGELVLGGGFIE